MSVERVDALVEDYWRESKEALIGLDFGTHARLNAAIGAVDTVWDRHLFVSAETFGGTEIGFARALSGAVLKRLLGVEYAALVSVAGTEIPPTGDAVLDESLTMARQEALDTFSGDLLGPVRVEDRLVYAKPVLLESPVPIGAVLLACREPLSVHQSRLLEEFLRHFDTRLSMAERMLVLRWRNLDLEYENKKLSGEIEVPKPLHRGRRERPSGNFRRSLEELIDVAPALTLFGVTLPTEHFGEFCDFYSSLTDTYLTILENAEHLFLDVPSGVDAKNEESKLAAPYFRLLGVMGSLREATHLLFRVTAEELLPFTATGGPPTFSDLTRVAKGFAEDETARRILEIMNDRGEDAELDALAARSYPYEFRAANIGEVFALLALSETIRKTMPESWQLFSRDIASSLRGYEAARAYLLSYDRFEDVPLKGVDRTRPADAVNLLLHREAAPAFEVFLSALRK